MGGGVNGFDIDSDELCSFIDSLGLHNLPFQGSSFTYFGSVHSAVSSRIDRFLVSDRVGA